VYKTVAISNIIIPYHPGMRAYTLAHYFFVHAVAIVQKTKYSSLLQCWNIYEARNKMMENNIKEL
jgi:hypothetical protein